MAEPSNDFAALLAAARAGDEQASGEIVARYENIVRRAAHGLLGRPLRSLLDSVDIVQSVHRSLLIGLRHQKFAVDTPDQLVALALTMVRRKVAHHWRRVNGRQPRRPRPGVGEAPGGLDALPTLGPDPAATVQFDDQLRHLLRDLDEADRQLVSLRLEGHSTSDVARQLGLDPRVLRVRLGRLRKRLREAGDLGEWV